MSEAKQLEEMTTDEFQDFAHNTIVKDIVRQIEAGPIAAQTIRGYIFAKGALEIRIYDKRAVVENKKDSAPTPA